MRLAALFGCPAWAVAKLVPASEVPLWLAYWQLEPWGFKAQDILLSKTAYQIQSPFRTNDSGDFRDLMFYTREELLQLSDEEIDELSPDEQRAYIKRQVENMKRVLN